MEIEVELATNDYDAPEDAGDEFAAQKAREALEERLQAKAREGREEWGDPMQYCQKCRVIIHGGKACCPLCQAPLSWIIPAPDNGSYNVENFGRASESDPNNKFLRYNSGYGYACYASSTGGALSLYKRSRNDFPIRENINRINTFFMSFQSKHLFFFINIPSN